MNRNEVMELFNKRPRIGALSTANQKGEVNVAVFGSPQMIDENTVVMGIGKNRSLANLRENPHAVFIVVEPGKTVMDWKGARVYLEVVRIEEEGDLFNRLVEQVRTVAGNEAAAGIRAAVTFRIEGSRPIIDPGSS